MKKSKLFILLIIFTTLSFFSCKKENASPKIQLEKTKPTVITTIFASYDWTKNIAGQEITLEGLFEKGVDIHNFQPTVQDIIKISDCDLFIYVGGESDNWVTSILKNNPKCRTLNLLQIIGDAAKEEELIEGMQVEHEIEHEHKHAHEDECNDEHCSEHEHKHDDSEIEYDEHVWLSIQNAKIICSAITKELCQIDNTHQNIYNANCDAYCKKLSDLDLQYKTTVANASKSSILVADRFPFRYLVDDYEIKYFAAFIGCSAETEASFKTIKFLSDKIDEQKLNYIFTIENSDNKIAKTVIENSTNKNQQILKLNSMQAVTSENLKNGITYIEIMKENLTALKIALE